MELQSKKRHPHKLKKIKNTLDYMEFMVYGCQWHSWKLMVGKRGIKEKKQKLFQKKKKKNP